MDDLHSQLPLWVAMKSVGRTYPMHIPGDSATLAPLLICCPLQAWFNKRHTEDSLRKRVRGAQSAARLIEHASQCITVVILQMMISSWSTRNSVSPLEVSWLDALLRLASPTALEYLVTSTWHCAFVDCNAPVHYLHDTLSILAILY